mgnify:CR=1 FL=1
MVVALDTDWSIRRMDTGDLDAVVLTEQAAYEFPWSRGIFEDCLQVGYPAWVAERRPGEVVGHAVMSLAVGEAHVLNICSHPHYHGMGLGRALMNTLIDHAWGESAIRMFLEVRASNQAAIGLYRTLGFKAVGERRGYYPAAQGREDAVVLMIEFS